MPLHPTNTDEVLAELDRRMSGHGNGSGLAAKLDMEPSHLRSMRSGCLGINQKVARELGFELRWVKAEKYKASADKRLLKLAQDMHEAWRIYLDEKDKDE